MKTPSVTLYSTGYRETRTYLAAALFAAGNIVLPQLCHLVQLGGPTMLPIYFFTLVGAYKYGWRTGLLTALASPLVNAALFGMPAVTALPAILVKSALLAGTAGYAARRFNRVSVALLAAVVLWFSCWNTVMTSDKLMHLFGRVVPALSLLLSMTLRFVPRFQAKLREVTAARRGMGLYAEKGRLQKLKSAVTVFSVLVTWSLENAVETADSMKSRGYGLPGRTAFSLYRYSRRDRLLLLWLALCGAYVAAGWALGGVKWRYYPTARGVLTPYSASVLLAYFLLCLTPVLLQRKEARTWSSIASKA